MIKTTLEKRHGTIEEAKKLIEIRNGIIISDTAVSNHAHKIMFSYSEVKEEKIEDFSAIEMQNRVDHCNFLCAYRQMLTSLFLLMNQPFLYKDI